MKSLHERLDHQTEEVLEVAKTFGRFRAMEQFQIKDYPGFCRWLKEVTGDENFGISPKIRSDGSQSLGDQLVDAFLRKVSQLTAENERLRQKANLLEWQLSHAPQKENSQSLAILQSCEV